VRRHHADLLRLLRGVTRNVEDAEDLTQEAFLRAFRALDRFDLLRPFRPWLWTIGLRLALQRIARKESKNVSLETAGADSDEDRRREGPWTTDPLALDKVESPVVQIDIFRALESLDPDYRAVVVLRALENRTYEEIAELLEIPKGTVMSRLSRARARLRVKLKRNLPGGDQDG